MIALLGVPTDTQLDLVGGHLADQGRDFTFWDQRRLHDADADLTVESGRVEGRLHLGGQSTDLQTVHALYNRPMALDELPAFRGAAWRERLARIHRILEVWSDTTPIRVVNRLAAMASNSSKPYQAQLIQDAGFAVPETLVTNDPDLVRDFAARHPRLIYKSISAVRSVVSELAAADLDRLDAILWCPAQFQEYVNGFDIRVHVVGEQTFATRIDSEAIDYRYAARQGGVASFSAFRIDDDLACRCVALTARLGLSVSGVDLRLADDGEVFCFEVNPSPAFGYYEQRTGQEMSRSVAYLLACGGPEAKGRSVRGHPPELEAGTAVDPVVNCQAQDSSADCAEGLELGVAGAGVVTPAGVTTRRPGGQDGGVD
ncbi:hypothetical protein ACIA5D_50540 [Actinoplanes sp. NPDC051513]|uniref:hypothetical protein n=1 Tax=Actinoplanes sp. NPDC051513 TaxID=3363908 RepID=UPI0037BBF9A1